MKTGEDRTVNRGLRKREKGDEYQHLFSLRKPAYEIKAGVPNQTRLMLCGTPLAEPSLDRSIGGGCDDSYSACIHADILRPGVRRRYWVCKSNSYHRRQYEL